MANDREETHMHGNPEMHGGHEDRGDGGLGDWGHPDRQGREHTGYGQPRRFDQHGGQSGQGHAGGSGDHDPHHHDYRNWRDQQMQAFDREYEEYRRHRQERFNADFEGWRKGRGDAGSKER